MNNYPLIRFVLIFIAGILVQTFFNIPIYYLLISILILSIPVLILQFKTRGPAPKNIMLILLIMAAGSLYYSAVNQKEIRYPFEKLKISNAGLFGTVSDIELNREGRVSFIVESDSLITKEKKFAGRRKIYCAVYDDDRAILKLYNRLAIGQKISILGTVQKPRNERNPGEYDYEKYLYSKKICALFNSYKVSDIKIVSYEENYLPNLLFQLRKVIDQKIKSLHNRTTAGLLRGLILADRKSIDYEVKGSFVNAGVVHVLAVSGLHVGYIVLIFVFLFGRFSSTVRYILTISGLLLYLIITGANPPVFRATIMAVILLTGPALGRDYNSLNALALAALVILLIDPHELFNPGFQLSFSAILSLIFIYPQISAAVNKLRNKSKILKWLLLFAGSSIAAQIGTLPFTLAYFHKLSVTALIANFVVIPLSGMIVGLGLLTLLAGSIFTWIGMAYASSNELLTYFLYWFVSHLGSEKYSYLMIHHFSRYDALVFYIILALIFYLLRKPSTRFVRIITVSLCISLMLILMRLDNYELTPGNILSVIAVDVGQGDAFLVKFPDGKAALVDAGDKTKYFDNGQRILIPLLDQLNINTLDYAFISHVDSDHYKGIEALVEKQRVKMLYKPQLDTTASNDIEFERVLRENNCSFRYYSKVCIPVGNTRIYVLNDTINNYFTNLKSNERSGVLKLVFGNTSFLFTGDAGIEIEDDYIKKYGPFLHSDVLKVGHHGSKSSTGDRFLKYVDPKIALISAGIENKFGHPNKLVLDRLNKNRIAILRTDQYGAILLQSDGRTIRNIDWKKMESGFVF